MSLNEQPRREAEWKSREDSEEFTTSGSVGAVEERRAEDTERGEFARGDLPAG